VQSEQDLLHVFNQGFLAVFIIGADENPVQGLAVSD